MRIRATAEEKLGMYLTADEITKSFGICRSGLFSLIKRGLFPAGVKIGRSRRWPLSEVLLYLEAQHQKEAVHE